MDSAIMFRAYILVSFGATLLKQGFQSVLRELNEI